MWKGAFESAVSAGWWNALLGREKDNPNMFAQRQFAVFLLADQCPPEDEEGFGFFWNGILGAEQRGVSELVEWSPEDFISPRRTFFIFAQDPIQMKKCARFENAHALLGHAPTALSPIRLMAWSHSPMSLSLSEYRTLSSFLQFLLAFIMLLLWRKTYFFVYYRNVDVSKWYNIIKQR